MFLYSGSICQGCQEVTDAGSKVGPNQHCWREVCQENDEFSRCARQQIRGIIPRCQEWQDGRLRLRSLDGNRPRLSGFCQEKLTIYGVGVLRKCLILKWRTHQELNLKPSDPQSKKRFWTHWDQCGITRSRQRSFQPAKPDSWSHGDPNGPIFGKLVLNVGIKSRFLRPDISEPAARPLRL